MKDGQAYFKKSAGKGLNKSQVVTILFYEALYIMIVELLQKLTQ